MKKKLIQILTLSMLCLLSQDFKVNIQTTAIKENLERKAEKPWKNKEDYNSFIKSTVNKNYKKITIETYNYYNISRETPKYGFKVKEPFFTFFDSEGAIYKERKDSVYFFIANEDSVIEDYMNYYKDKDIKAELEKRIKYYISHEVAHAYYYDFGKSINASYLFNQRKNTNAIQNIKESLISEGVAEYIAYRGNTKDKNMNDSLFEKMVKEKNDFYLYRAGLILVKPILDKNFKKGIEELIKNPLTEEDIKNLPEYREKIMKKLD